MKKIFIATCCILLLTIIGFIIFSSSVFLALPRVVNFVQDYYENFNKKEFIYMYNNLTCEEFKSAMDIDTYSRMQNTMYTDLGRVLTWEKGAMGVKPGIRGWHITVPCTSKREKGIALETFTLKRLKNKWLLYRFDVKSS